MECFGVLNLKKIGLWRGLSLAACATITMLSACGPEKKVAVAPPPPPVVIPPRPLPPMGAQANMAIPALAADGSRTTVNSGISSAQALWNLRAAYNVAALNCMDVQHASILGGYRDFLKKHAKQLAETNKAIDNEYKKRYGAGRQALRNRDTYETQVYNFFALPPVVPALCNAAMGMVTDLQAVPANKLDTYTVAGLTKAEAPYKEFFNSYDQYRADLAAWESRYGPTMPIAAAPAPARQALSQ